MSRWQLGGLAAVLVLGFHMLAHAEIYTGFYGGITQPGDLNTSDSGNIKLQTNPIFGVKGGFYLPQREFKWFGVEAEIFRTFPNIKQQTLPSTTSGTSFSGSIPGSSFSVTTVAMNALVRIPGHTIQPYVGLGIGLNVANLSDGLARPEAAFGPSFNILAGVRGYLTSNVALFGEFKHTLSQFEFTRNNLSGSYSANMFVAGISFHILAD